MSIFAGLVVGHAGEGHTNNVEQHIRPMKLLLCAIRTASLTDMEPWPLLSTTAALGFVVSRVDPRWLHKSTGSNFVVSKRSHAAWGGNTHSSVVSNSTRYRYPRCRK